METKTAPAAESWFQLSTFSRSAVLFLMTVGFVVAFLVGGAAPASAHANLLFASPAFDATVATAPNTLTLFFDEPVTILETPVKLAGTHGNVALGTAVLTHKNTTLQVPVTGTAGQGIYTVTWQVTADDGDTVGGSYRFAVGPAAAGLNTGQATGTEGSWQTGMLRGLLFAALALSLGEAAGRWLLRRIPGTPARPRPWTPWAGLLGLGATLGLALLLQGGGSLGTGLTHPAFGMLVSSWPGILTLTEVAGFAVALVAALVRRPGWSWPPLVAVLMAEALRAHPGIANPLLGVPLTLIHLAAAALWVGTLVYILRTAVAWRHQPGLTRAAIGAYARPAIWIVVAVTATGLGAALLLVPLDQVTTTDYGRVLMIKIVVVAVAAGFALLARQHLRRNAAPEKIRRPARLEAVALFGVLALSALLTLVPPPTSANAALPLPPPATGPVVPAAALAGQIEVNTQASAGQLVVRLDAPELTDRTGATITTNFTLTGTLAAPSGTTQQLVFRSCGAGCFLSPVTWRNGATRLTLSPTATGSKAALAGLTIDWPPVSAGNLLTEAISATQAAPSLTLHERVTSDTSQGLGAHATFQMTGTDFVRHALFASGTVPAIVRLPDADGNRRIAISYPAENALDELTLAPDGRILRETLTAPNHLITHTLIYPHTPGEEG